MGERLRVERSCAAWYRKSDESDLGRDIQSSDDVVVVAGAHGRDGRAGSGGPIHATGISGALGYDILRHSRTYGPTEPALQFDIASSGHFCCQRDVDAW